VKEGNPVIPSSLQFGVLNFNMFCYDYSYDVIITDYNH